MHISDVVVLLLPVAAMSGWWSAMRSVKKQQEKCHSPDPNYIRGLNYVLNEQPDKAIDLFIKMLEVDNDTVEAHLALGGLFRRRGETERAIRIHQNLISRKNLSRTQRAQGLLELAQDYFRAGLFDRAVNLFKELLEFKALHEQALLGLRSIYQQEREWQKCIYVCGQLAQLTGENLDLEISHYYCEIAQEKRQEDEQADIHEFLEQAQKIKSDAVRPLLIGAKVALKQQNYGLSLSQLEQIERLDGDYFSEIFPDLLICYQQLKTEQALVQYLEQILQEKPNIFVLATYTDILKTQAKLKQADQAITDYLKNNASLAAFHILIKIQQEQGQTLNKAQSLLLKDYLSTHLATQSTYQCRQCGYSSKMLHWQCPSCRSWSTTKPV